MLGSELVLDFGLTYKGPLLLMKSSTQWHSLTVYTNQRPASMFCPVMSKSVTLTESVSVFSKFVTSKALRQVVVTPPEIIRGIYRVTTEQLRTGGYPLSSLLNKGIADAT
jgi:hypothetical protein